VSAFTPKRFLRNGHLMTLYAWGKPRRFPNLLAPEERLFQVTPETQVLAHCHWQRDRAAHPLLLVLHGLEGSSSAHYMQGIANKAFGRGFNVILLNQRNCGGTEHLGPGLYHSGLTDDAAFVMREIAEKEGVRQFVVAGYSLGGNLALKLAGDYGDAAPEYLRGVCAVSPVIELAACVDALERKQNVIYQWNFVRGLRARMRRKQARHPGRFDLSRLSSIYTVRTFDDVYTAPHFGFGTAANYYQRASAMRVVDRIRVPALIITAADDPFVPVEPFRRPEVTGNPRLHVIVTEHGGHCGFVSDATGADDDGYWAEAQIVAFAASVTADRSAAGRTPDRDPALRA
jgi:predicted alpha/beta-fold hydrolase